MGNDKRRFTAALPRGWRDTIFNAIPPGNERLRDAIAVLHLSGCRPAELAKGVEVELVAGENVQENMLVLRIEGSKVGAIKDQTGKVNQRGQPYRELLVRIDGPSAIHLAERVKHLGIMEVRHHRKAISSRIGELSKIIFPRKLERVSAYCFRHQFSADLKSADVERDTIATALGHLSDYSAGAYGRRTRGGKNGNTIFESPIVNAVATKPIKHSAKTDRLLRFKLASLKRK
jgi:integrase